MNLLLAGLEPSVPTAKAVAWQYLTAIGEMSFDEHTVETVRLPAVWDDCYQPLLDRLRLDWDCVVCLAGKSGGSIAVERVAINETDASIKDRSGRRPRGKKIVADGDPGYWSGLPYRELSERLSDAKLEATRSHSAGAGLANYVFYRLMHTLSQGARGVQAGLLHLPERRFEKEDVERFFAVLVSTLGNRSRSSEALAVDLEKLRLRGPLQSNSL